MSSSFECKIRTLEVWGTKSPADWMATHKPTELSTIKQNLECCITSMTYFLISNNIFVWPITFELLFFQKRSFDSVWLFECPHLQCTSLRFASLRFWLHHSPSAAVCLDTAQLGHYPLKRPLTKHLQYPSTHPYPRISITVTYIPGVRRRHCCAFLIEDLIDKPSADTNRIDNIRADGHNE